MVELNFDMVSWSLLISIFLAKVALFISVFVIAIFVLRRKGIGKGGLYGIFVTQSNDFAIGYPIGEYGVSIKVSFVSMVVPQTLTIFTKQHWTNTSLKYTLKANKN